MSQHQPVQSQPWAYWPLTRGVPEFCADPAVTGPGLVQRQREGAKGDTMVLDAGQEPKWSTQQL